MLRRPANNFKPVSFNSNNCVVRLKISQDTFYRYGYLFSRKDYLQYAQELEWKVKALMRCYIGTLTVVGYSVADAIRIFQNRYNFNEEVWSFESIKKDIDRNTSIKKCNDVENFLRKLDLQDLRYNPTEE